MILVAGAYPAAPRRDSFDTDDDFAAADAAFTSALVDGAARLDAGGLELAWQDGRLHPRETEHLSAVPAGWQHVVTTIPDTMITWRTSPTFGLASPDDSGRSAALGRLAALRDRLESLAAARGSALAAAVLVHSAPRVGSDVRAGRKALASSLLELAGWDWAGAQLLVEHCDAGTPGHPPAKGFLPVADELAALDDAVGQRTGVGLLVNWGRSVIEGRSRAAALDHIATAAAHGHLRGLMFSGVAAGAASVPWLDNHLPTSDLNPDSLLRPGDVSESLAAARDGGADLLVAGVKVTASPTSTVAPARAADVVTSLAHVAEALVARS
jgi:Domain of unknown function (DUF4862)